MSICRILPLVLIFIFLINQGLKAEEIKEKNFTIVYDSPELKYYSKIIKEYLITDIEKIEKITGLNFKRKFLVNIYKNTDPFLDQKAEPLNDDFFIKLDSASCLSIIFTTPNNYYSNLSFHNFLQKKLLLVLFRQNKIPENNYFEEAFFEILVHEINAFGLISITELNTHLALPIKNMSEQNLKEIEITKNIKNTPENIKQAFEKINFAKTILLLQRDQYFDNNIFEITEFTKAYIKKLKKTKWMEKLNTIPNDKFISELNKKRNLYAKILENFNGPSISTTENITQEYVFRMTLRLLLQKQTALAYSIFKEIEITPPTNPYYSELGLFFSKKFKTDQNLWLEYFLINQSPQKPVDFDIPEQVSNLLLETLSKEMPDFQVTDKELDFIRTLQYLIYIGKKETILEILEKDNNPPYSIETKNYIWAIGILLNNKKIIKDYNENLKFFESHIWEATKTISR